MSDWRDIHADQNTRLAQKMLEQQGQINALIADNREKDEELQALGSELTDLREIVNTSTTAQLARDVLALVKDYSDPDEYFIARLPFLASFDQLCFEKYGISLDD